MKTGHKPTPRAERIDNKNLSLEGTRAGVLTTVWTGQIQPDRHTSLAVSSLASPHLQILVDAALFTKWRGVATRVVQISICPLCRILINLTIFQTLPLLWYLLQ